MARVILTGRGITDEIKQAKRIIESVPSEYFFYVIDCEETGNGTIYEIARGTESMFERDKAWHGADYYMTIERSDNEPVENRYELFEAYIPNPNGYGDTILHSFGTKKTLGGAIRNMLRYGNTTDDKRKPLKVWM